MVKILSDGIKKKTDHDICISAKHHSDQYLLVMLEFYTKNKKEINEFIADYTERYPNYHSRFFSGFYEVNKIYEDYDTLAFDTEMSQDLMKALKQEVNKTSKLQDEITKIVEKVSFKEDAYNPFSLQFENAILFTPSGLKFYQLMKETVYKQFPEVKGIQFDGFIVKAGTTAFGTHNGRPPSIHYKIPFQEDLLIPKIHKNFWVTLTQNSYEKQPLVIFEESGSESPSIAYMYKIINQNSQSLNSEDLKAADAAFYGYTNKDATLNEKIVTVLYIHTLYLQGKFCGNEEKVYGSYWELNPGQGLIFNDFKAHGDSTLPVSNSDRVAVSLRCFSETKTYESVWGAHHSLFQNIVNNNEKQRECILKIFGYKDKKDFLKTLYGDEYSDNLLDMPIAALLTDVAMGYSGMYKGPERMDILTMPEGLNRHYERSKDFFQSKEYTLNDDARQCIEEYYLNLKKEDITPGYYNGHTVGDIYLYLKYKGTTSVEEVKEGVSDIFNGAYEHMHDAYTYIFGSNEVNEEHQEL